ncbi:TIGR02530 family flagellar biosynthesis protein [Falsibacillus pallidus]|uniref:Flagellar operon protein n=1 Tax=Falsibacillus pallidus TaxID=493781 RepID=A0A370H075_9BACI|nr:TIGR02530 family flagellar biosynthesis protein [Falsibacillus pallidus]RDI47453.1 flagellar operon protein [Falsibacillus pallidus]
MDRKFIQGLPSQPITSTVNRLPKQQMPSNGMFKQQLQTMIDSHKNELTISKHAGQRLQMRGIEIPTNQWREINQKVQEAKQKGVTDSLVILPNAALIVSAKNKTVITAMTRQEAQSQIFTNINGTILIDK